MKVAEMISTCSWTIVKLTSTPGPLSPLSQIRQKKEREPGLEVSHLQYWKKYHDKLDCSRTKIKDESSKRWLPPFLQQWIGRAMDKIFQSKFPMLKLNNVLNTFPLQWIKEWLPCLLCLKSCQGNPRNETAVQRETVWRITRPWPTALRDRIAHCSAI